MDFHALQRKLFEMDPSDPAEDMRKLRESAGGRAAEPTKDYVNETAHVEKGSLPLGIDSIEHFARLAGVTLSESQKTGSAGQLKGKDKIEKNPAGTHKNPTKDKLVGEGPLDTMATAKAGFAAGRAAPQGMAAARNAYNGQAPAPVKPAKAAGQGKIAGSVNGAQLGKQLGVSDPNMFNQAVMKAKMGQPLTRIHQAAFAEAFQKLMAMDPQATQKAMMMLKKMEVKPQESTVEAVNKAVPKPRDPSSNDLAALRKSGAGGAHKDKKKALPRKDKHKGKVHAMESKETIKDMLYRKLNESK